MAKQGQTVPNGAKREQIASNRAYFLSLNPYLSNSLSLIPYPYLDFRAPILYNFPLILYPPFCVLNPSSDISYPLSLIQYLLSHIPSPLPPFPYPISLFPVPITATNCNAATLANIKKEM